MQVELDYPEKKTFDIPTLDDMCEAAMINSGITSDRRLAKALGVQPSNIVHWLRGLAAPGFRGLAA